MRSRGLALAILVFVADKGYGQTATNWDTVQFLYQACKEEADSGAARFCLGYMQGVGQLMAGNGYESQKVTAADTETRWYLSRFGLCPGPSIGVPSGGAMIQAFVNWAEKHPEAWAQHALAGVAFAFAATWPCPKSN